MVYGGWFMLAFWAVFIIVVMMIRIILSNNSSSRQSESDSSLDILKDQYTRGEIDEDEFNQKRKALLEK